MTTPVLIGDATLYTRSQRHRMRKRGINVPFVPQRTDQLRTPEANEKRKMFGPDNPQWQGDDVTPKVGRKRALRMFPSIGPCVSCGNPKSERHHKDENPANNAPDNIEVLCRKCHMRAHKELRQCKK
jgi:5-methylcytosine-specific restriction endonuclease McrA